MRRKRNCADCLGPQSKRRSIRLSVLCHVCSHVRVRVRVSVRVRVRVFARVRLCACLRVCACVCVRACVHHVFAANVCEAFRQQYFVVVASLYPWYVAANLCV
jgi:hypothetical protein